MWTKGGRLEARSTSPYWIMFAPRSAEQHVLYDAGHGAARISRFLENNEHSLSSVIKNDVYRKVASRMLGSSSKTWAWFSGQPGQIFRVNLVTERRRSCDTMESAVQTCLQIDDNTGHINGADIPRDGLETGFQRVERENYWVCTLGRKILPDLWRIHSGLWFPRWTTIGRC